MKPCFRSLQCKSKTLSSHHPTNQPDRIDRYTATPTTAFPSTSLEPQQYQNSNQIPTQSPTSSMRTNLSSSGITESGLASMASYQQFPAQSARIPTSHSQADIASQVSAQQMSPQLNALSRDSSWPLENTFRDLHVSGSEPRIFPGLVSRTQRRDSLRERKNNANDEERRKKRDSRSGSGFGFDGIGQEDVLDEEEEKEESDGDMEEAGGLDG